jgi:hypothetical protein
MCEDVSIRPDGLEDWCRLDEIRLGVCVCVCDTTWINNAQCDRPKCNKSCRAKLAFRLCFFVGSFSFSTLHSFVLAFFF